MKLGLFTSSLRIVVLLVALALFSGLAASSDGPVTRGSPLILHSDDSGYHLSLGAGDPFHTTGDPIRSARLNTLPDSAVVVVTWEELSGTGERVPHYALSLDGRDVARVAGTHYRLDLAYAEFDPLISTPAVPPDLAAGPNTNLYLVQFIAQPLEVFRQALRDLGATVYHYVPNHAHIVRMDAQTKAQVEALPFVRWVGPFHPAYRVEGNLLQALQAGGGASPAQRYNIMLLERGPTSVDLVADHLRQIGAAVDTAFPQGLLVQATLTPEQLLEVVRWDEVLFVDRWGRVESDRVQQTLIDSPRSGIIREIGGADFVETFGFDGTGVRGEVLALAVDETHCQLQRIPPLFHGPRIGGSTLGSEMFAMIFGSGDCGPMGLLHRGQGISADWTLMADPYQHTAELLEAPYYAVFQTRVVGSPRTTMYTTISAQLDDLTFLYDLPITQSMSNAATNIARPEAWAKNVIAVGGFYHYNTVSRTDDCWCHGASTGPASDGRIKPDLVHIYDYPAGGFGGTTVSTLVTAGYLGLAIQVWGDGILGNPVIPHGTVFENRPHMSTAKALAINTAYRYDWTAGGPNSDMNRFRQGWGTIDVKNLYDLRRKFFIVDEDDVLSNLEQVSYNVVVEPGEPELKVTLVYTDPPGNPAVQSQHRVNDLTLKVTSPTNVVYFGNNGLLAGNWSEPGGSPDLKNTVENVFLQDPEPGEWTVEISADELLQDAHLETPEVDADFALVVSGVFVEDDRPPFIARGEPFTGFIDPRLESNDGVNVNQGIETLVLNFSEEVRNVGGGPLTSDAFTVSVTGGVNPGIASIDASANPRVVVNLDSKVPLQEWTTIEADVEDSPGNLIVDLGNQGPGVNEGDRVDVGFLPGDTSQNERVEPLDHTLFRGLFIGAIAPERGFRWDYVDTDRNGSVLPLDLTRWRQLLIGASPATRTWMGESLNHPRP